MEVFDLIKTNKEEVNFFFKEFKWRKKTNQFFRIEKVKIKNPLRKRIHFF